jgi:hypothetical protein
MGTSASRSICQGTNPEVRAESAATAETITAGEAIRHLSWDFTDSRLGLIGLMEPTTRTADYKGLFLTTDEPERVLPIWKSAFL